MDYVVPADLKLSCADMGGRRLTFTVAQDPSIIPILMLHAGSTYHYVPLSNSQEQKARGWLASGDLPRSSISLIRRMIVCAYVHELGCFKVLSLSPKAAGILVDPSNKTKTHVIYTIRQGCAYTYKITPLPDRPVPASAPPTGFIRFVSDDQFDDYRKELWAGHLSKKAPKPLFPVVDLDF